ncbi:unnamed protein product, partial [Rotaria sordida]
IIYPLKPIMFIIYASKNDIANEQSPLIFQSIFRQFILTICRFFVSYISIAYISLKSNLSRISKMGQMNDTNNRI